MDMVVIIRAQGVAARPAEEARVRLSTQRRRGMMAGGETAREAAERGIAMIDHMLGLRAACLRELPAARAGHPDAVEDLRSCLRELRLLGIAETEETLIREVVTAHLARRL